MTSCEAAVPVGDSLVLGNLILATHWIECGLLATAFYEYRCSAGHVKTKWTCPQHEPEAGIVGCRECWDSGSERPMTFTAVA